MAPAYGREAGGDQGDGPSEYASISGDGRMVVFESQATNLVHHDTNAKRDIFVNDRKTHKTTRIDVSSAGDQADSDAGGFPTISSNGRFAAFSSPATNLVNGDTNTYADVFVRDLSQRTTKRVSPPT